MYAQLFADKQIGLVTMVDVARIRRVWGQTQINVLRRLGLASLALHGA